MTASLIVAAVGAVVAAAGTGVLAARSARTPRMFLIAWTTAVFALAIALGAQALGYLTGYTALIFRCVEIGAQALAPLALSIALVELIGRSVPARFAMRLTVSAIGIVVLVILGSDPLGPAITLSTSWPDPTVVYQVIPLGLIELLAAFTLLTAVVAGLVVLARAGRGGQFSAVETPALCAAAASALVAVPGVMMLAHVGLRGSEFALTGLLAAALTWLSAAAAVRRGLAHDLPFGDREQRHQYAGPDWYEPAAGRDYPRDDIDRLDRRDDYPSPEFQGGDRYRDRRPESAAQRLSDADDDVRYPALAALAAERSEPAEGLHDPDSRSRFDRDDRRGPGGVEIGDQMFGQITIYTLLDDRLEDFDRMTEQVVQKVRSREPGTLVYIVHAVPTAPMQRILYEVYRDRAAYDEHLAQPYVSRFMAESRPMVLATNAIELGLQQAKVTPLPSYSAISDILSESGIDLTGVTKSARGAAGVQAGRRRPSEAPDLQRGPSGHHHHDPSPLGSRGEHQLLPEPGVDPRGDLPLDPHPRSRRHEPGSADGDGPGYQDWDGPRDEDPWYR